MKRHNLLASLLLPKSPELLSGLAGGIPVSSPVEVLRDRYGIPHIFAASERDLMVAQGFVHAQDRLWQMESMRRLCAGTLAELVGESGVLLDHWSRLAGLGVLWERAYLQTDEAERDLMEAYAQGVNAYLDRCGKRLPLELRRLGRAPDRWTARDVYASLPLNALLLQANFMEEVLALLARGRVSAAQWNELYASHPGAELTEESFFAEYRDARFGKLLPAALALFPKRRSSPGGSNAWSVSRGEGGAPLLANDPHLGVSVPPVWHFCHLSCPTLDVLGGSMPGSPGVVIGRNAKVAWGFTTALADYLDLYAVRVDPARPTRYYVKGKAREMERESITLRVAGKPPQSREITIYRTEFGPVITELDEGVDAAACVKWYGTLPEGEMEDTTVAAFRALQKAGSVKEALEAAGGIVTVSQNIVAADSDGHIGWHVTGRVPVRRGYSGRVPADGSSGACRWTGFVPYERAPHIVDPPDGRIVSANQMSRAGRSSIGHSWCAPYRHDRIQELLGALAEPTIGDFARIQSDVFSLQAAGMIPVILAQSYTHPDAVIAAEILRGWDFRMSPRSSGPLVFSVFLTELARTLAAGVLREDVGFYIQSAQYMYTAVDRLLDPATPPDPASHPLLQGRSLAYVCEEALVRSIRAIRRDLGSRRSSWRWGRVHTYRFHHRGAGGGLASWLLDRGRYPASGGNATVNISATDPTIGTEGESGLLQRFEALTIPSLRMITPLADPDATLIAGPMGQSGQPASRHYDDLLPIWREGEYVPLPLTRKAVEAVARSKLTLTSG